MRFFFVSEKLRWGDSLFKQTFYVVTMTWLTATEYLCHKWPRICPSCHKHFPVLSSCMTYHRVCNSSSAPVVSGVRVTRSLVLCAMFCRSFGHCVVGSSPIYGFWLPLWYLQTLLPSINLLFFPFLWDFFVSGK